MMMICLRVPPPPNTAADMAHSTHSTQPALGPHRVKVLCVGYTEQTSKYGIIFMVGLFGEYSDLAYVRIRAMYRVNLAECVVLMFKRETCRETEWGVMVLRVGHQTVPSVSLHPPLCECGCDERCDQCWKLM